MLEVTQICKDFGSTRAVDSLSLNVEIGQICGLLGPNGAGKTTAIRMICGVLAPTSGTVAIQGVDIEKYPSKAKQDLGYVPDGAPLPPELLPKEFLHSCGSLRGLRSKKLHAAIDHWSTKCEIEEVLHKPIGTLSRGYRQRVALTSALLHDPTLLILDEPSTGLDPVQRNTFHSVLKEVSKSAAILYSSHHLSEVEQACDSVAIINHGKLIGVHSCHEISCSNEQTVEVCSEHIANLIHGENVQVLESGWVRCTVTMDSEFVVDKVQEHNGKLRLLQPAKRTLESMYIDLITETGVQE